MAGGDGWSFISLALVADENYTERSKGQSSMYSTEHIN